MTNIKTLDDVTMESVPGSHGWVFDIKPNKFGEACAVVVWEHHNGVRALIPVHKLSVIA